MMKRITTLIFLGLLLFNSLTATAMAYPIDGALDTHDFSLIDTVLAQKTPSCGNCLELKHIQNTPNEHLAGKIPACGNCVKSKQPKVTPDELPSDRTPACGNCLELKHSKDTPTEALEQRAAGCSSCEDEGDSES
jgi:hypothetical protein